MGNVISLAPKEITPDAPRHRLSRELPPIENAPILREYGRLGLNKFVDKYAVQTELDDRGFVDYGWLLGYVDSLVSKDFVWSSRLDIHHLQWEGNMYDAARFDNEADPTVPEKFREIPFHKLLIPRQMHDFIHLVTLPPEVPEYDQMKRRLDAYDTALDLFQKAKQSMDIEAQSKRLIPAPHPKARTRLLDPVKRKLIERDVLVDRYVEMTERFQDQLSVTTQQDVEDLINMDMLRRDNPMFSLVTSLDKAVRLNKQKQAIRPKVRWTGPPGRKSA